MSAEQGVELMSAEQGVELLTAGQWVESVSAEQWVESRWWDGEVKRYQAGLLVACLSQFLRTDTSACLPACRWKDPQEDGELG